MPRTVPGPGSVAQSPGMIHDGPVGELGTSSWGAADVVSRYATDGHTDAGERMALQAVETWARGRVLDVGVGGGRTTGMLAGRASSYLGLDIAPEMLELARRRHPGVDLRVGDASDLGDLPDDGFDLVVFSYNGLDALDRAGRKAALGELARVVADDGRVVFSTLSLDGVSFDEAPWRLNGRLRSRRNLEYLLSLARHPGAAVRGVRNFRMNRARSEDGDGWALRPLRPHEFRFVVHFATLADTVSLATAAGLEVLSGYADDGRELDVTAATTDADYVHLVCRPRRD